ncbi:MAG TPA: phospholipase D-like domain-containing protein [Labilithrix sp.]
MSPILAPNAIWRTHDALAGVLVDGRDYYRAFYEAARHATRSILLLGWQFDSDVLLLRGEDAPHGHTRGDLELLGFLDGLCRTRPDLEVRVLAWDYSLVFALEREAFQKVVFDVATCKRFQFRWDDTAPLPGSHHQKVAIVDGRIAFLGSQDICQSRWDDSAHVADNPLRTCRGGTPYQPYHEVQAMVTGDAARSLVDLFVERWRVATGEPLDAEGLVSRGDHEVPPVTLPLPRARVALARTMPRGAGHEPAHEIREQLVRAIRGAERLVYTETQYLTSGAVRDALEDRMRDRSRPLEIVVIVPRRAEKLKEELTVGLAQRSVLAELARAAEENGHRLGVYDVAAGGDASVYVHSKLLVVDDRFLTIGSANLTNRSMTIDSEINASWEASSADRELARAIRRVRVRLLLEHLGDGADVRAVVRPAGLVDRLDAIARARAGRLRMHPTDDEEQSLFARTMHGLALEYLDPAAA